MPQSKPQKWLMHMIMISMVIMLTMIKMLMMPTKISFMKKSILAGMNMKW